MSKENSKSETYKYQKENLSKGVTFDGEEEDVSQTKTDVIGLPVNAEEEPVPAVQQWGYLNPEWIWLQKQQVSYNYDINLCVAKSYLKREEMQMKLSLDKERMNYRSQLALQKQMNVPSAYVDHYGNIKIEVKVSNEVGNTKLLLKEKLVSVTIYCKPYPKLQKTLVAIFCRLDGSNVSIKVPLESKETKKVFCAEVDRNLTLISTQAKKQDWIEALLQLLLSIGTEVECYDEFGYYIDMAGCWQLNRSHSEVPASLEGDEAIKLLKVLPVLFNILNYRGHSMDKPIVLQVDNTLAAVNLLENENAEICTGEVYKSMLQKVFEPSVDYIYCIYSNTYKAKAMMEKVTNYIKYGDRNQQNPLRLPIILTSERIPREILPEAFVISLDLSGKTNFQFNPLDVCPDFATLNKVLNKLEKNNGLSQTTEDFLNTVACALSPFAYENGEQESLKRYYRAIQLIYDKNEEGKDLDGIGEIFIEELYDNSRGYKLLDLSERIEVPDDLESIFFTKGDWLYMSQKLFSEIIQSMEKHFRADDIKEALKAEKILIPGNPPSYSSKMNIIDKNGNRHRFSMLRFDLNRINRVGLPDFVEFVGGNRYED